MNKQFSNKWLYAIFAISLILLVLISHLSPAPEPVLTPQPAERPWDNDRVIEETKKCEAAGLKAERWYNGWIGKTNRILCVPKDES